VVVKLLFFIFLSFSPLLAQSEDDFFNNSMVIEDDPVTAKIKSFLNTKTYQNNEDFIKVIFDPKLSYYIGDRVDVVKVIQTLKDNGLLKLFFKSPQEFTLNFKTNGSPIFFVKIMDDVLRGIGYYRYVTSGAHLNEAEFSWSINLTSEYMTDPLILQTALNKSGCEIIDINKENATEWSYVIDIGQGELNVVTLESGKNIELKRSLYAHWFDISKIRGLNIKSSRRNHWYPYISYYDSSLHLLKLLKRDKIYKNISLVMPKNAKYIKISDLYTLKNLRDGLTLSPSGSK